MQIEFVDAKVKRVRLADLKTGDTFISCNDQMGDVNMFIRRDTDDRYEFVILGEYPEIVSEIDHDVQIVKTKLLVEI